MDKLERIYQLQKILRARRTPISRQRLEEQLDCSRATLTRLLRQCRDYLHIPIQFDPELKGYYLEQNNNDVMELPGFWFSSAEIHALMISRRLLAGLKPGLFEADLAPLRERMESLLQHKRAGSPEIFERVRILAMTPRDVQLKDFQRIADALINRHKLRIQYSSRSTEEITERWISPQRLVYYRDNWYVDAWCHLRDELRTFSADRMNLAEIGERARDLCDDELDKHFTHTYGIFGGAATNRAVIRFSEHAARWVSDEQWHPDQTSRVLSDGGWELTVPYGQPEELVRDILKFGADAEVLEPKSLRKMVREKLVSALNKYQK